MVDHIDFRVIREDFNIYEVENGQILKEKQMLTDISIIDEIDKKDNKNMSQFGFNPFSYVITSKEIDTSNMESANPANITEKDQIKELSFRTIQEIVNIYETNKVLIFVKSRVRKIFWTNKKDIGKIPHVPILRFESEIVFNAFEKDSMSASSPASIIKD